MDEAQSLEDVVENLRERLGNIQIEFLDLSDDPEEDIATPLASLADSMPGGLLMVLLHEDLLDDEGVCTLEGFRSYFPIVETRTMEVEEGMLWLALVGGAVTAPGTSPDSTPALRNGELSPVLDAELSDLDLNLLGIQWSNTASEAGRNDLLKKLAARGIVTPRQGEAYPTRAGIVAIGHHPHSFIPGACIELTLEGQELCWRGSMTALADKARSVTAPCLQARLKEFLGILMNMLLHRDLRTACLNTPVRITVADGLLIATNPGVLDQRWRVGKSAPSNPSLHAMACDLKLARGRGDGLRRIDSRLVAQQLRPFDVRLEQGEVKLVVPWPRPPAKPVRQQTIVERRRDDVQTATRSVAPADVRKQPRETSAYVSGNPTRVSQPAPPRIAPPRSVNIWDPQAERGQDTVAVPESPRQVARSTVPFPPARPTPEVRSASGREAARVEPREEHSHGAYHVSRSPAPQAQAAPRPTRGVAATSGVPGERRSSKARCSVWTPSTARHSTAPTHSSESVSALKGSSLQSTLARSSVRNSAEFDNACSGAAGPEQPSSTTLENITERGAATVMRAGHSSLPAPPEPRSSHPDRAADSGGEMDQAIVLHLRQKGPSTTRDLMEALSCTRWAVRSSLERLMNAGIVRTSAASARSPLQMYELV